MAGSRTSLSVVYVVLLLNILSMALSEEPSQQYRLRKKGKNQEKLHTEHFDFRETTHKGPAHTEEEPWVDFRETTHKGPAHTEEEPWVDFRETTHKGPAHLETTLKPEHEDAAHKANHVETPHKAGHDAQTHKSAHVETPQSADHEDPTHKPGQKAPEHKPDHVETPHKPDHEDTTHKPAYATVNITHIVTSHTTHVPEVHQCPSGYQLIGSECFYFSEKKSDWMTARIKCEAMGAVLAHVNDLYHFKDYVIEHFGNTIFWLGGHIPANEDHFIWTSGEQISDDIPWGPGNPSGNKQTCLSLGYNQAYDDDWCCRPRQYVCSAHMGE